MGQIIARLQDVPDVATLTPAANQALVVSAVSGGVATWTYTGVARLGTSNTFSTGTTQTYSGAAFTQTSGAVTLDATSRRAWQAQVVGLNTEPPSGYKMFPPLASQTQSGGPVNGSRTYYVPFFVPRLGMSFDRIGLFINFAGASGGSIRLGVFDVLAASGLPGTVLIDSGAIAYAASFSGEATATISWAPSRIGWFYLALTLPATAPATIAGGGLVGSFGGQDFANGWQPGVLARSGEDPANAYTASPAPTASTATSTAPAIYLRRV